MNSIISVDEKKCIGCGACIRACPSEEANGIKIVDGKLISTINSEKCITCGACISACPHEARIYSDDLKDVIERMKKDKLEIIVDPAIKTAYPLQWKGLLSWFKTAGCSVYDASFGCEIYSWALKNVFESEKIHSIIPPTCPSVVNYIKLFQPNLAKSIAPIYSPIGCTAVYIRKYLNHNHPLVLLTTCIAKKQEFQDGKLINYCITAKKLVEYLTDRKQITTPKMYENSEYDFDGNTGLLGNIMHLPGGVGKNILIADDETYVSSLSGGDRVYKELNAFSKQLSDDLPEFYDVISCEHGCGITPASDCKSTFNYYAAAKKIEIEISGRSRKSLASETNKLFKRFDDELNFNDFVITIVPSKPSPVPLDVNINDVLSSMGKKTAEERNVNCGLCGYDTCYKFATAVYRGLCPPEACRMSAINQSSQNNINDELVDRFNEICDGVINKVEELKISLDKINNSNNGVKEKTNTINTLLTKLLDFCNSSSEAMVEEQIAQVIRILEATIKAIGIFDVTSDNMKEHIDNLNVSLQEINKLVRPE